jgi:orotidine 5'-phosphate decarboxylase subfamily 1
MLTYAQYLAHTRNPTARRLLTIIEQKQSNLAVSADVTTQHELLQLAQQVGPSICVLKTHADIVRDFDDHCITQLTALAAQHNFLLFEDRKFADIGHTVRLQYSQGIHRIADWASITDAHPLPGDGVVQGLQDIGLSRGHGLLLLAQMSSASNLITAAYTQQAVAMAARYPDFVIGFICQTRLSTHLLHFTPGVQLAATGDALGQQYITPSQAICEHGSDVIIVGRGIYQTADPKAAAEIYRTQAWQAYQQR